MGIEQSETKSPIHWRSFLALEQDLDLLSRYVEISKENFSTYSLELSALLLSAGSEVDVVAKQLCQKLKPKSKSRNIGHYAQQIASSIAAVPAFLVLVPKFGMTLNPWQNWRGKVRKRPAWWAAYNSVKHERHKSYHDANLGNALNALAGLLVLTLYLYRDLAVAGKLSPNPTLFRPEKVDGTTVWDTEILINYTL